MRSATLWFYSRKSPGTASCFPSSKLIAEPLNPLFSLNTSKDRRPLCLCGYTQQQPVMRENFKMIYHN